MSACRQYIYICAHKSKAGLWLPPGGHTNPVNQHWDAWALLRHYEQVHLGEGWCPTDGCAMPHPRMRVWAPEIPSGSHPLARHGQQFEICFPSLNQVPIDATAGWAASPVGTS